MTNDEPQYDTDDSIATKDDLLIQRDGEGELATVEQELPGGDKKVEVIPLTSGDINTYDTLGQQEMDNEEVARLFNNHLAMFDEGELSAEDIEQRVPALKIQAYVEAIMEASGQDLQNAVNQKNLEMLEDLDEGKIEALSALMENQEQFA